jgi:DNA-binding XRE family transcriptional regulator
MVTRKQPQWARLGKALEAARLARRPLMKPEEVAVILSVGKSTIYNIENGKPRLKVTQTILDYADLLGWPEGAVDAVLGGAESPPISRSQTSDPTDRLRELTRRVGVSMTDGDVSMRELWELLTLVIGKIGERIDLDG